MTEANGTQKDGVTTKIMGEQGWSEDWELCDILKPAVQRLCRLSR